MIAEEFCQSQRLDDALKAWQEQVQPVTDATPVDLPCSSAMAVMASGAEPAWQKMSNWMPLALPMVQTYHPYLTAGAAPRCSPGACR